MLGDVLLSYRTAFRFWLPLLAAHLFIRLVVTSLMVPLLGLALATTLLFSDQTALTDQDIARFLLTPAGAIGAILVLSLLLVALVLDVVIATALLRQRSRGPVAALRLAAGFLFHSVRRLFPFVAQFLLRLVVLIAPFVIAAGVIAYALLTEHDINYYLTARPSEFLIAAGLIGLVVLALVSVLLARLSSWAIAMHLALFDDVAVFQSFGESRRLMKGHRLPLIGRFLVWFALRFAALAVAGVVAAFATRWISGSQPESLEALAGALIAGSLVYAVTNSLINALSNGALADLLNEEFDRALFGREPALRLESYGPGSSGGARQWALIAGIGVLAVIGLGTGGLLAERLGQDASAEIIAHRGAAAVAPENTMASVLRAIEDGADWIEIDVQESAEGEVIVAHDSDFMKAANVGTKVWEVTAADLAEIDVGSWFDPAYSDQRVPRLAEVLEAARDEAGVLIELKYYGHDEELEARVAALVEAAGMADQVSIMSLKYPAVQKMQDLRPEWRTGVLAATFVGDLSGLKGDFLALNQAQIRPRVVREAEESGKAVYAWTVNDPTTISRMLWIGVDGLITDDPALAREVVDAYNELSVAERFVLSLSDRVNVSLDRQDVEALRP